MNEYKNFDNLLSDIIERKTSQVLVFAGAGTGKTHTIVQILRRMQKEFEVQYQREGRHIAVITYTNAAVNEIDSRIFYNPLFSVSTIHSFLWEVISINQAELKKTFLKLLDCKIANLKEEIRQRPKATSVISQLENTLKKRDQIAYVKSFSYNAIGLNSEVQSLSHDEVIKIGALMIKGSTRIKNILCGKFPFILVDESQDTNKDVVDALINTSVNFYVYINGSCEPNV